ncbi:acyl-protein synthetase LuxE [Chitinophaga skermanii]|uniref:Acyl-protein synthetase LuxE n=1 Tax=Chitinophaga skermanii TaxID=331697 RepID=A0A327QLC4_9BACT|nr:acyl transferase [Chitinophaga skermanii]RAJ05121.1 acyl-protein synthetase LuxE [Chitinophaga skermanii]
MNEAFVDRILNLTPGEFEAAAIDLFHFQYQANNIYRAYVDALRRNPADVKSLADIPFLPIQFFKSHKVVCGEFEPQVRFESSGTTQSVNSQHLVKDVSIYEKSFRKAFELFYGDVKEYRVIGLLPSYLERQHSSLVYMVKDMIEQSAHPESGFYLYEHDKLKDVLTGSHDKTLLIGVTFGLLDFADQYTMQLPNTIIMETGGMKGRREEWTREEVHSFLSERFGVSAIHSEYGMTELLSQAYSKGKGIFQCPPWMKVILRDENDPFDFKTSGAGVMNVVDLANIYSSAFIATEDIGKLKEDGRFEVLGRLDQSALRGCSLMVS